MHRATLALAALAAASAALPAPAHWTSPEELIRRLESNQIRHTFDVREVRRDPALPRLLLIRVGPRWSEVPAERRTAWAEEWNHLWRSTIPSGIVAVLDAGTDQPLVNFDPAGRATLKEALPGKSTPSPDARPSSGAR